MRQEEQLDQVAPGDGRAHPAIADDRGRPVSVGWRFHQYPGEDGSGEHVDKVKDDAADQAARQDHQEYDPEGLPGLAVGQVHVAEPVGGRPQVEAAGVALSQDLRHGPVCSHSLRTTRTLIKWTDYPDQQRPRRCKGDQGQWRLVVLPAQLGLLIDFY